MNSGGLSLGLGPESSVWVRAAHRSKTSTEQSQEVDRVSPEETDPKASQL